MSRAHVSGSSRSSRCVVSGMKSKSTSIIISMSTEGRNENGVIGSPPMTLIGHSRDATLSDRDHL